MQAISTVALTLAGDSRQAMRLANDLAARFPNDTLVQFNYLPVIHAGAALESGNSAKALEALAPAAPYELGVITGSADFTLYPIYLRGEAFLAAHQGAEAAAEFQKILDHTGIASNEPISALAHLGLGRAYALSGNTAKAKASYQDFLTLWKVADPEVPIYRQAKAERQVTVIDAAPRINRINPYRFAKPLRMCPAEKKYINRVESKGFILRY